MIRVVFFPMILLIQLAVPGIAGGAGYEDRSVLAPRPQWENLDRYENTLTAEMFREALMTVYCPHGNWHPWIELGEREALIVTGGDGQLPYRLRFAEEPGKPRKSLAGSGWGGRRIAIDPGHLGGRWSAMEHRHVVIGDGPPVKEGDAVLAIARLLRERLEAKGVEVLLVREGAEPVTQERPETMRALAMRLVDDGHPLGGGAVVDEASREAAIGRLSRLLFYRVSEIRARAEKINAWQPDLTLCLHINAGKWEDPEQRQAVSENHMHFLVNGTYGDSEIRLEDQRFAMIQRLMEGYTEDEILLAEELAIAFYEKTGLPPFEYTGSHAVRVGRGEYVWARNLMANRLYMSPVVFLEPYVANHGEVYDRLVEAGEGLEGGGRTIYEEYAESVMVGLGRFLAGESD